MHDPTASTPNFGALCRIVMTFEIFPQRAHVCLHIVQY